MDIKGTGYATSLTNLIAFVGILTFSLRDPEIRKSLQWPNKKIFSGVRDYLALGIPSAIMLMLEWWAYELMTLMSGYIGVNEQAA